MVNGGSGTNENEEEVINEAFEKADVWETRDDAVQVVEEEVGIWGSHAASHSRAKDLEKMVVEEGKGIVFENVVEDDAKDLSVGSVRR